MRILSVSTVDIAGGAERVARNLSLGYQQQGHDSRRAVGFRRGTDEDVFALPNEEYRRHGWAGFWFKQSERLAPYHYRIRGTSRLSQLSRNIAEPRRALDRWRGREDFDFPATAEILRYHPDILHAHNLHGGYFDLRYLTALSQQFPVVLTLHDMWLLTGHCAHSFDCNRWQVGCGKCPDLSIYPAIQRDATAYNWQRKHDLYKSSKLYISTPCNWLMDKVRISSLMKSAVETKVIPYGVDLSIFHPGDRAAARDRLGLPQDAYILLFSAASIRQNPFKDYDTLRNALRLVAEKMSEQGVIFLALGEDAPTEKLSENVEIRFAPFVADLPPIADYYRAADVYTHAARADTFPNAVLEALACGIPVIGSAVGGIPEQVRDIHSHEYPTGILVPVGDAEAMANAILQLVEKDFRLELGSHAVLDARWNYDLNHYVQSYLKWFSEILVGDRNTQFHEISANDFIGI
jgi:glycosyltransferase involved in cell wall biosynthesis